MEGDLSCKQVPGETLVKTSHTAQTHLKDTEIERLLKILNLVVLEIRPKTVSFSYMNRYILFISV